MQQWTQFGLQLIPLIISAVTAVEKLVKAKGLAKQDAAIDLIKTGVQVTEFAADKDLLDDAAVDRAARAVITAIVELQNIVATRAAGTRPQTP